MAKRKQDTGEQTGVNCPGRIKRKGGDGSTRCGRPMYWRWRDGAEAVCRQCDRVEMLFRPKGMTSNRPPPPPPKSKPADGEADEPDPDAVHGELIEQGDGSLIDGPAWRDILDGHEHKANEN